MAFTARPILRAAARPVRGLHQARHAQQGFFSTTTSQQKLPGGTPGETKDPSEQKTPLGPYYESMLIDPQPIPKTKPEAPPASSPNAPRSTSTSSSSATGKAKADASKKTTTEAGRLPTDPDPVPAPPSPIQPPLSASAPPAASSSSSSTTAASEPSLSSKPSSPITFGTKLGGPANEAARAERLKALRLSQGTLIAGIRVPPRPDEPDNCCMSGCVNCVWDRYRDDMEEWAAISMRAEAALQAQRSQGAPSELGKVSAVKGMPSVSRVGEAVSMDDDGGGSDTNWVDPLAGAKAGDSKLAKDFWDDELYKNVPVGIREFMKQEKRLKEKHAREGTRGG
ncbi:oxidoreductase-like protein [Microdochium trichocladiopsis]|uniref:Oxidoreductase-like protein n=1 Tax=Microdochium trichocladiopsis TaxID=1682393 RepID=A0A9P8YJ24_9PEZI|nr:oxidoreductase-like protein [Microdochium trichocladiopsis]KAH7040833.1 oxidoreductase-like protein [Microdochium trichocladiopsis]